MATLVCPRCSKTCPSDAAFCRRCGAELSGVPLTLQGRRPPRWWWVGITMLPVAVAVALVLNPRRPPHPARVATPAPPTWVAARPAPNFAPSPFPRASASLPPLPPLPAWKRHLPADLPPAGTRQAGTADYRGQILTQGRFGAQPLSDAVFAGADLLQADFERADLDGADFRGADLSQADFAGADLSGARFDESRLHQTRFVGLDTAAVAGRTRVRDGITEPIPAPTLAPHGAGRASFRAARLSQVSLEGMDLAGADFEGAEFSIVGLRGADLRNANLRDTRHQLTDFQGARLDGADLSGADLSSARNLTPAQLASARTDARTRMPR